MKKQDKRVRKITSIFEGVPRVARKKQAVQPQSDTGSLEDDWWVYGTATRWLERWEAASGQEASDLRREGYNIYIAIKGSNSLVAGVLLDALSTHPNTSLLENVSEPAPSS